MKNLSFRFFLLICALFLNGHANAYQVNAPDVTLVSQQNFVEVNPSRFEHTVREQAYISTPFSLGYGRSFEIEATESEVEEDEIGGHVQYFETGGFYAAIFYATALEYLSFGVPTNPPFRKLFSYFSSFEPLYLAFRVIRL